VATWIEVYEVGRIRFEVISLCPDAKLHRNVSKIRQVLQSEVLTIESQEPVQSERASLLTPKQLTRLS